MADDTRVTRPRKGFALVLALLLPLIAAAPAAADGIVVQRDPGLSSAQRADVRADAGVRLVETLPMRDSELVSAPDSGRALARLARDPRVRVAAPNVAFHLATNDPTGPPSGASPRSTASTSSRPGRSRRARASPSPSSTRAWTPPTPDLAGQVRSDGVDYVVRQRQHAGPDWHGTEVAGVIAAVADNGKGIAGMAPQARILPLRAFDDSGAANLADILAAFDDAGDRGIRVVSASFGTDPGAADPAVAQADREHARRPPEHALRRRRRQREQNVDAQDSTVYPCDVTSPNLICVGAQSRDETWFASRPAVEHRPGERRPLRPRPEHLDDASPATATASRSAARRSRRRSSSGGGRRCCFSAVPRLSAVQAKSLILDTARRCPPRSTAPR